MKKLLPVILGLAILFTGYTPGYVNANQISIVESPSNVIRPMMTYIATASCFLYIDSDGNATVDAYVYGYPDTVTKTTITSYLQQYKNGSWVTIKSWSTSADFNFVSLYESAPITKGYKYRAKATVKAYSGSSVETRELTTSEATY